LSAHDAGDLHAIQRRATADATAVVNVRNLGMGYGKRVSLDNASFEVRRGEIAVVLGGSGSGKSSLMPAQQRGTQPQRVAKRMLSVS
jgi:ABC-type transporter Mla maintaining outer membrane lipid asymmetry ATPase subunit MlaF